MSLLRLLGLLLMLSTLVLAWHERRQAYAHWTEAREAARFRTHFLFLKRRARPTEFTGDGWLHWQRAAWLFPVGWLLGGALVVLG